MTTAAAPPPSLHMRMESAAIHMEYVETGAVGLDLGSMVPLVLDLLGMIATRIPDPITKVIVNAAVVALRGWLSRARSPFGDPME